MLKFFCLIVLVAGALAAQIDEDERILGGQTATRGQFPYQVSLRVQNGTAHFCGGTLISNRFILTAGICAGGATAVPRNVHAILGAHTRNGTDGTRYALDLIVRHPRYNPFMFANDIAVARTARPVTFTNLIRAIPLPTTRPYE